MYLQGIFDIHKIKKQLVCNSSYKLICIIVEVK